MRTRLNIQVSNDQREPTFNTIPQLAPALAALCPLRTINGSRHPDTRPTRLDVSAGARSAEDWTVGVRLPPRG